MKLKMAADQVLKRFSRQIRKEDAFSGADLILRHHDNSLETAPHIRGVPHAHHSGRFRSSPKIEPGIDTHSRRHTTTV